MEGTFYLKKYKDRKSFNKSPSHFLLFTQKNLIFGGFS